MEFRAKLVTWDEIESWCTKLRESVKADYRPDAIVGLSRGGLVPARILSDSLLIKDLYSVKTEHWGITATKDGKTVLRDTGRLDVSGKKILVVDDITDTGESMKIAVDFIKSMGPSEVRSATMLHIGHSTFVPDYYAVGVSSEEWTWFTFPWNVFEDLFNLAGKILEETMTTPELAAQFKERFGLDISEPLLESRLGHLADIGKLTKNGDSWAIH